MPNTPMVQVTNLVKVYPGGVRAVDSISFGVQQGEFVGFLGPNGAGKSTTLKILSTLLKKTSGKVTVAGYDVDHEPMQVRQSIGFAMQEVGVDDLVSGWDFLITQGQLYGMSRLDARMRAGELLDLVGLTDSASRKIGTYSGGMRRRIDLVGALMHRPPLLFLDEPTTGLDPQSRLAIWAQLEKLNQEGITVLLTTQIMEEADRLCQRIAIIDRGRIVAEGTPRALKQEVGGDVITIALDAPTPEDAKALADKAEAAIKQRGYVSNVSAMNGNLVVTARDGGSVVPDLLSLLSGAGIAVKNLSVASPTLDDVFLKYTGHQIRGSDASGDEMNTAMRSFMGLKARR